MTTKQRPFAGIPAAILDFPETSLLCDEALPASFYRGAALSPTILLYGPNAVGKSFFQRVLAQLAKKKGFEPLLVSMGLRTAPGMHRCFMYSAFGDQEESSGLNSFIAASGALRTAQDPTRKTLVILDEPDIGLSDGYAEALGEWLAREERGLHAKSAGIVLCTHSKPMVRRYLECAEHEPHAVNLRDDPTDVGRAPREWLEQRDTYSVEMLESLGQRAKVKRRLIDELMSK